MAAPFGTPQTARSGPENREGASAPPPALTPCDAAPALSQDRWWDAVMRAAVRWRLDEPADRRLARAFAALLSLPREDRETIAEHLGLTWGRNALARRLTIRTKGGEHDG